jgi:HNH endonuclease
MITEKLRKQWREASRRYNKKHPEKRKEMNRKWRERNKDKWNKYCREYQRKYREKNSQHSTFIKRSPEQIKIHSKIYQQKYYKLHKEKISAYKHRWYKNNIEGARIRRNNRRSSLKNAEGIITTIQWKNTIRIFKFKCAYCYRRKRPLTRDHVIALANGGTNWPENIVPCCIDCNLKKQKSCSFYWEKKLFDNPNYLCYITRYSRNHYSKE